MQVEVRALHHALAAVAAERDALRKLIHPHRQCKRRASSTTTAATATATATATAAAGASTDAGTTAGAAAGSTPAVDNRADSSAQLQAHYLTLASSQAAADRADYNCNDERGELVERLRHKHCKLMQQAHDR
jgi:hypothetical protein